MKVHRMTTLTRMATLAAFGAMTVGLALPALAEEMIITSEIAPTHWKAGQMDALAADITERTDGRIQAKTFHASTLYTDKNAMTALGTGAVHMVWAVSNWLETINSAYGIITLPFGISDEIMLDPECRAGLTQLLEPLVEDKGIGLLGLARTTEAIFLSKQPMKAPADMKGQKVRVPSGKLNQDLMEAWGASPVSMATTEIPTALGQGVVDMALTSPGGWQMVGTTAKYANIISGFAILNYSVLVDENWLDGLSEQDRKAVIAATDAALAKQWPAAMEEDQKALDAMVEKGGQVVHISQEAAKEFERLSQPVIANFKEEHPEVTAKYDEILAQCR